MTEAQVVATAISQSELMMFRQIHPSWIVSSRVTSMAFKPTPKDNKKLSVRSSGKISAEGAFKFHTETLALKSSGSWGVSIEEISKIEMKCFESPINQAPEDLSHCHIEFDGFSNRDVQDKADKLATFARARGPLYSPPEPGPKEAPAA